MFPGTFSSHLTGCSETKKPQFWDTPHSRAVEAGARKPWETCFSSPAACSIQCKVPAQTGTTSCHIMVIFRQNWWFLLEDLSAWKTNVLCKMNEKCISLQLRIFRAKTEQIYSLNGRFYSICLRIQEVLLLHGKFHVARSNSFSAFSSQGPYRLRFLQTKRC